MFVCNNIMDNPLTEVDEENRTMSKKKKMEECLQK